MNSGRSTSSMMRLPLLFLLACLLGASTSEKPATLTIYVSNIPDNKGEILLGLIAEADKDGFPEETESFVKKAIVKVNGPEVKIIFEDIPPGTYAFSLLHDTNGNKVMDKSFFGLPEEGYAFSNNFKPVLSAPNFDDCAFQIEPGENEHKVVLIH